MKTTLFKKKQKGIAERKTELKRKRNVPYKAIGLGLLLWLLTTWLFFGHGIVRQIDIAEGQRAPSTIVAAIDFECQNLTETAFLETKASDTTPHVFTIDPAPAQRATKVVRTLFEKLGELTTVETNQHPVILSSMNGLLTGSSVSAQELVSVFPTTNSIASTRTTLLQGITLTMNSGILSEEYRMTLFRDAPDRPLSIRSIANNVDEIVNQRDIYSTTEALQEIYETIETEPQREVLQRILPSLLTDNMKYDEVATESLRDKEVEAVQPVIQQYTAGTTLVRAGEQVTPQIILLLQSHEQKQMEEQELLDLALEVFGNGMLLLAGLIASSVILRIVAPAMIRKPEKILLLVVLSLFTLGVARLLTYFSVQYTLIAPSLLMYLVPHAMAVLLASILLGGSAALCLGFWTSFATSILFDQSFNVFALGILITITATSTAHNIHRRSSLFQAGIWVCAIKILFVLVLAILNSPTIPVIVGQIFAAILAGMLSTILTLLLLPLFEKMFKITTDLTLLELSDMGHPLLQKMAMQAPGTYHHSLMVATLAQNAAEAIGANSLLVRVCAYYHDIGKMAKPEFFTENIQHKENPHDELSPHMSALVISSHVKEGLTLAKRHKLPQPVLDAIEQHHGNGLISYFFHKAKTQKAEEVGGNGHDDINDSDFRYGGAPAVSPEMAILALADSSEAASRSIEKPTPQKITNMMNDIFAGKIRDGQLDAADLTMAQINVIKESFIFSLSNMLHGRIPYPKDNENKPSQPTDKSSDTAEETTKAN